MFIQKTSQGQDDVSILLPSLSRQLSICEDPHPVNAKLTGEVILPSSSVLLPPRDDAAEYDDSGDTCHFQDNPKYVCYNSRISKKFLLPSSLSIFSHSVNQISDLYALQKGKCFAECDICLCYAYYF
jgi:hypothetical protein